MRLRRTIAVLAVLAATTAVLWHTTLKSKLTKPTTITLNIGHTFEQVKRASSYDVASNSYDPARNEEGFGTISVDEPAVILHFVDPQYGFVLAPTKFAMISFWKRKIQTVATSPMVDPLPFDEAVNELEKLQRQFQRGGWVPWEGNESTWFDFSPEGKRRLYKHMFEGSYAESTDIRAVGKYSAIVRLKCFEGCLTHQPPYRFLIDVGVSDDNFLWWDALSPEQRERELPPPQYRKCNGFKAKGGLDLEPVRPPMPPCKPSTASTAAAKQP